MEDQVWTFARGSQRLTLRRQQAEGGIVLIVTENGTPRSYFFDEITKLTTFQVDMEAFLIGSGWSFIAFSPERRSGVSTGPAIRWACPLACLCTADVVVLLTLIGVLVALTFS